MLGYAEPGSVNLLLCRRRVWQRDETVRSVAACAELDEQGAQVVRAKDRQVYKIGGVLLRQARVEEIFGHAQVVEREDLIAGIQPLLIRRRTGVNTRDHKTIFFLREVSAEKDSISRRRTARRPIRLEPQSRSFERNVVIELLFRTHEAVEEVFQAGPRHQLTRLLKILRRIVAVLFEELRVQVTHHVIQRLRAVAAPANLEVEKQPEYRAFVIVRNLRVYRVLILPVILDPGVKTRLFHTLHQTSGRILQRLDRSRSRIQKLALANQPGATQNQVCVVVGDSFRDPEILCVIFLRVIKGPEGVRPDSFHVPEMKKLVRHEREKTAVIALRRVRSVWCG